MRKSSTLSTTGVEPVHFSRSQWTRLVMTLPTNSTSRYFGRKLGQRAVDHAGDAGAAVIDVGHPGRKAQPIVRLAEALVVAFAQQHRHGRRVAIGGEQIAERIEAEAERVHLPPGELLDRRAVGPKAIGVARCMLQDFVATPRSLTWLWLLKPWLA